MTDRELLELAAKAAGIKFKWREGDPKWGPEHFGPAAFLFGCWMPWNPLTDDGDALRLAVKLGLQVGPNGGSREPMVFAWARDKGKCAEYVSVGDSGPESATRRAITRAAAEIGKAMKEPTNAN